jgi:TatD DNase family protein
VTGYTDTHCHLWPGPDGAAGQLGAEEIIAAAWDAGVTTLIDVGTDATTSSAAIERARRHAHVHATAGLHPHEAVHGVDTIVDLVTDPQVVAVGECGLDYHYDHSPRAEQRAAFAAQIQLARQHGLPLVVHTREAWDDTFDVLAAEGVPGRLVFHCFTGGVAEARRCLDIGAFLSFSGIVTFKKADDVQAAAAMCPLDRLLVETDSPYLAPVPHRGATNQPAFVPLVAQRIAELRGMPTESVRDATVHNALLAFPKLAP